MALPRRSPLSLSLLQPARARLAQSRAPPPTHSPAPAFKLGSRTHSRARTHYAHTNARTDAQARSQSPPPHTHSAVLATRRQARAPSECPNHWPKLRPSVTLRACAHACSREGVPALHMGGRIILSPARPRINAGCSPPSLSQSRTQSDHVELDLGLLVTDVRRSSSAVLRTRGWPTRRPSPPPWPAPAPGTGRAAQRAPRPRARVPARVRA